MNASSASDSNPSPDDLNNGPPRQAACLNCRKSKIKCRRGVGDDACEKCAHAGLECEIPTFHAGRQKGVKNKRTGLDKAVYQIEEAIKRHKANNSTDGAELRHLQRLLDVAGNVIPAGSESHERPSRDTPHDRNGLTQREEEPMALDDVENPLQLLARASDIRTSSPRLPAIQDVNNTGAIRGNSRANGQDVPRFFLPTKNKLDVDDETEVLDPVSGGLVTDDEAETLFAYFYEHLAHTRWGLDPSLHTMPFVRGRSAFLLTSILAASALFIQNGSALAKRLEKHRDFIFWEVLRKRYRSVEVVLALMVNIPWMHPGDHSADDDTGLNISTALSIALDLSLNKIVTPSVAFETETLRRVPKSDCIDARKALAMDGFEHISPESTWGQRLLRRRERAWIALFVVERGVCLARGRSYTVPITPLLKYCNSWHNVRVADTRDAAMLSMAVIRRDLDDLFNAVRQRCDSYRVIDVGSKVAEEIEATINHFYDSWYNLWTPTISDYQSGSLPPYVEILVTHMRLSTYCGVLNHPTAPFEVKRLFRASALTSALNVMRAAIQGERRLSSMPNNTVIMICFAGGVALKLSTPPPHESLRITPSVRSLIEEAAAVLERIGNITPHRNGASILYGKYLREILRQSPATAPSRPPEERQTIVPAPVVEPNTLPMPSAPVNTVPAYTNTNDWIEPLHFSAMSDNEVMQAILNAGPELNNPIPPDLGTDMIDFSWSGWMEQPDFSF